MYLKNGRKSVSDYVKLDDPNELPQDSEYSVVMVRRKDYDSLEQAHGEGAAYELRNNITRIELLEGIDFANTAARMFDDNYGGIDFYICQL